MGVRIQPIVVWLAGIAALIALLALRGGFQRPVMWIVAVVFVIALLIAFFLFRRRRER